MSYNYDINPWDDPPASGTGQQQQPQQSQSAVTGGYAGYDPSVMSSSNYQSSQYQADPYQYQYSYQDTQITSQPVIGEDGQQQQQDQQQQQEPPPGRESWMRRFMRSHIPLCGSIMDTCSSINLPLIDKLVQHINRDLLVSKMFYFFFYSAFGSLFPLMGVYFKQLGMNPAQVGILTGVRPFIEIFSAPFWHSLADRFQKSKALLLFSLLSWIVFTYSLAHIRPPASACIAFNDTDYVLYTPYSANDLSNYEVNSQLESSSNSESSAGESASSSSTGNEMFLNKPPSTERESKEGILASEENQNDQRRRRRKRQVVLESRFAYSTKRPKNNNNDNDDTLATDEGYESSWLDARRMEVDFDQLVNSLPSSQSQTKAYRQRNLLSQPSGSASMSGASVAGDAVGDSELEPFARGKGNGKWSQRHPGGIIKRNSRDSDYSSGESDEPEPEEESGGRHSNRKAKEDYEDGESKVKGERDNYEGGSESEPENDVASNSGVEQAETEGTGKSGEGNNDNNDSNDNDNNNNNRQTDAGEDNGNSGGSHGDAKAAALGDGSSMASQAGNVGGGSGNGMATTLIDGRQQAQATVNKTKRVYKQRHKTPPTHIVGMSPITVEYAVNYNKERHSQFVTPMFSTIVYKLDDVKEVFFLLLLLISLGEFFSAPALTLADKATLGYLGDNTDAYGRQRMFGSLSWAITLLLVGMALDSATSIADHPCGPHQRERSYTVCFVIFALLMACALLTATQFRFSYPKVADADTGKTLVTSQLDNNNAVVTTTTSANANADMVNMGATFGDTDVDQLYASTQPRSIFNTAPPVNAPPTSGDQASGAQSGAQQTGKEKFEFLDKWKSAVFAQRTGEIPGWVGVFRQFIRNPLHLMYLFITWFLGCGVGLVFTFLFWHLQEVGGTPTLFGICSVINHISEILAYFFSFSVIKRFGHTRVSMVLDLVLENESR